MTNCPDQALIDPHVRPRMRDYVCGLYERRHFIAYLGKTQLLADAASTRLGVLWTFLSPMLLVAVYFLVFGVLFRGRSEVETFYSFLTISLFTFLFSSRTMQSAAGVMATSTGMMQNLRFPRGCLPLAAAYRELLVYLASLPIVLAVLLAEGIRPMPQWFLLLPIVLAQVMFNCGLAMAASRLSSHLPDIRNLIPPLVRILIYGSGVMYSLEFLADRNVPTLVMALFRINPFYAFVALTRGALLPSQPITALDSIVAGVWAALLGLAGLMWFLRRESEYANG